MQNCPLCLENKPLQVSHVIPNTFFKRLKKKDGRAIQSDMRHSTNIHKTQESWSEKILCRSCEELTNEFDSYVAAFTYNPKRVKVKVDKSGTKYRTYSNVNYKKFRLFQLSLLYRAALSNNLAYQHIKLAPEHMESIRTSLLNREPFSDHILGCQMKLIWNSIRREPFQNYLSVPRKDVLKLKEIVYFIFGGFAWEFYLPKFNFKQSQNNYFIKNTGFLKVPIVDFGDYNPIVEQNEMTFAKDALGLSKI